MRILIIDKSKKINFSIINTGVIGKNSVKTTNTKLEEIKIINIVIFNFSHKFNNLIHVLSAYFKKLIKLNKLNNDIMFYLREL